MATVLQSAIKEVRKLPANVQDNIGIELLDRVAAWSELREKIMIGIRQLDAGLGQPWSKKEMLAEFRKRHAARKRK